MEQSVALAHIYRQRSSANEAAPYLAQARALLSSEDHYNLARLESLNGNADGAFENLRLAAAKPSFDRNKAAQDSFFEWIRSDPRFKEIVGETKECPKGHAVLRLDARFCSRCGQRI
jgi:hypothetical protein